MSQLAGARIQVGRAAQRAPWRDDAIAEARGKLDEAGRQLDAGHIGSAIFFVSRASRIATTLLAEADRVGRSAGRRFVKGDRVNLRAEPSAEVLRRAHVDRVKLLELENDRLRADLDAAEGTLVAVESGMRGAQTRT